MIADVISTSMQQVAGVPAVRGADTGQQRPKEKGNAPPEDTTTRVQHVVRELNDLVKILHTSLQFSVDDTTKRIIVKVMDADTQKVIRQIPPEEMIRISARVQELLGVLIDGSA
jgi:flagellar protein FlaG